MYLLFNLHSRINIWKAFFQHSVPPWASQDTIPSSLNLPWRVSSHLPPLICILTAVAALGGLVGGGEGRGPLWRRSPSGRLSSNGIKDSVRDPRTTPLLSNVNLPEQAWINSFPRKPRLVYEQAEGPQGWPGIHLLGSRPRHDKCTLSREQLCGLNLGSSAGLQCFFNHFFIFPVEERNKAT